MARPRRGITTLCHHCGTSYYVSPSRAGKTRYCGKACFDAAQTGERRLIVCLRCNQEFSAAKDHGKWPKFCSVECRDFGAAKPEWKECPTCAGKFLATRTSHQSADGLRIYCSFKCSKEGLKNGVMKSCVNCGAMFYLSQSKLKLARDENCCSQECQHEFYTVERSPTWAGGAYIDNTNGHRRVLLRRDGFSSPYIGEHRVIASRAIGRMLAPHEPIIHINNVKDDNRPENLFICGSNSEMRKRHEGSLPWPKESNLNRYK